MSDFDEPDPVAARPGHLLYTCECNVPKEYRQLYDLNDEDSLSAFHRWIGKTVSDALLNRYGYRGLDCLDTPTLFDDDLGLLIDCQFVEQADGSMVLLFARERMQPPPRVGYRLVPVSRGRSGTDLKLVYFPPQGEEN